MDRPTFSPFWHRVRTLRPRLRPHVDVTRQHYRGKRWHVAHDPTSNNFYRLSPVGYDFVCTLDGARDVETAWKASLAKFGDGAPTQGEVIELLSQLYNSNLLSTDAAPETEQLLTRGRKRAQRRLMTQAVGLMYLRLRLLNPDPILAVLEPIFRPVLGRTGLVLWCALVLGALVSILPEWSRLAGNFDDFVSPANFGFMLVVFVLLKLWHELGHGLICKRLGGQVPEAGLMLLVFFPSPYVDASSAWALPSKWQRIAVGAGGMIFELAAASVAAFVWLATADGSLAKQLAYYAMLTASVSTVVFNINPLMKFDGYYMLADLLETPNLMQRSQQTLNYYVQKHVFRVDNPRSPSSLAGERAVLTVYGVLAGLYRIVLFFGITLFIMGQWFGVGLVLAVWSAAMWFILPVGKLIHWLASSSMLVDKRARAILTTLAFLTGTALLVGVVPLPDWRRASGVVESTVRAGVFFETEGFVARVLVRAGDRVEAGQELARLTSPQLESTRRSIEAQLAEVEVIGRQSRAGTDIPSAQMAQSQVRVLQDQLAEVAVRAAALVVRSSVSGIIVGGDPAAAAGAYVQRGQQLCTVLDPARLRIAASLPQGEGAWLMQLPADRISVGIRSVSNPWHVSAGGRVWSPAAAQKELPHGALGYLGGGQVETDQEDRSGRATKQPQFTIYIEPPEPVEGRTPAPLGVPGERVYVRFSLPPRPLMEQVIDRFLKLIQGRVNL